MAVTHHLRRGRRLPGRRRHTGEGRAARPRPACPGLGVS